MAQRRTRIKILIQNKLVHFVHLGYVMVKAISHASNINRVLTHNDCAWPFSCSNKPLLSNKRGGYSTSFTPLPPYPKLHIYLWRGWGEHVALSEGTIHCAYCLLLTSYLWGKDQPQQRTKVHEPVNTWACRWGEVQTITLYIRTGNAQCRPGWMH